MRMMQVTRSKRSQMNRKPAIRKPDRPDEEKVVPFKKRVRFLCSNDTKKGNESEKFGPSVDGRVGSSSHVASTRELDRAKILPIEKKSSEKTKDKDVLDASMSQVAVRRKRSRGRLPIATSARAEHRVEKIARDKNLVNAGSEAQRAPPIAGGRKQVDPLQKVIEHEGDCGESTISEPKVDGDNKDGADIDRKELEQTTDVIEHEGGGDGCTRSKPEGDDDNNGGSVIGGKELEQTKDVIEQEGGGAGGTRIEPHGDGIQADETKEVMEDCRNKDDSNNAPDDVNKVNQHEPVTNFEGISSHSRADTTTEGKNISNATRGVCETHKGKEPRNDVVSTTVAEGGHDQVKNALYLVDYGRADTTIEGNTMYNEGVLERHKETEPFFEKISSMVGEGGHDWFEICYGTADTTAEGKNINNEPEGVDESRKEKKPADNAVSAMVVEVGHDWHENALDLVDSGCANTKFEGTTINNETEGVFVSHKEKEPIDNDVSAMVVEGRHDWDENALENVDYGSADTTIEGNNINDEPEGVYERRKGKEPVDNDVSAMVVEGGHDWHENTLENVDYGSAHTTIEGKNINNETGGVVEIRKGKEPLDDDAVIEGGLDWVEICYGSSDATIVGKNINNDNGGVFETRKGKEPMAIEVGPDWDKNALDVVDYGSGAINFPLREEPHRRFKRPIDYIVYAMTANNGGSDSGEEEEPEDIYSPIAGPGAPLNPAYPITNPVGGIDGGAWDENALDLVDYGSADATIEGNNINNVSGGVFETRKGTKPMRAEGGPPTDLPIIGDSDAPQGETLSDTTDRSNYIHAWRLVDIPTSQHPMPITLLRKRSRNRHELGEGSEEGSDDAMQNANHTFKFFGFDIHCRKNKVAINNEEGEASGGAAVDGAPPMGGSDVSGEQVQPTSSGTRDVASGNNHVPHDDGHGGSSLQRSNSGVRLLGFHI